MLVLAVTLHNIPEGMAVGVVYAGYLAGDGEITAMGALAMSLGIAIQNFPEGAILSMPLQAEGMGKARAFAGGVLSTLACHLVFAKAIWLNLLPLGIVLVRLVHADLTEEKGLLSQKPAGH